MSQKIQKCYGILSRTEQLKGTIIHIGAKIRHVFLHGKNRSTGTTNYMTSSVHGLYCNALSYLKLLLSFSFVFFAGVVLLRMRFLDSGSQRKFECVRTASID